MEEGQEGGEQANKKAPIVEIRLEFVGFGKVDWRWLSQSLHKIAEDIENVRRFGEPKIYSTERDEDGLLGETVRLHE